MTHSYTPIRFASDRRASASWCDMALLALGRGPRISMRRTNGAQRGKPQPSGAVLGSRTNAEQQTARQFSYQLASQLRADFAPRQRLT